MTESVVFCKIDGSLEITAIVRSARIEKTIKKYIAKQKRNI